MIYDIHGSPLYSVAMAIGPDDELTAEIKVACKEGNFLRGTVVPGVTVSAKHEGGGHWVNIETTPIDLTPWDGDTEKFLIRFATGAIPAFDRVSFSLTVGP